MNNCTVYIIKAQKHTLVVSHFFFILYKTQHVFTPTFLWFISNFVLIFTTIIFMSLHYHSDNQLPSSCQWGLWHLLPSNCIWSHIYKCSFFRGSFGCPSHDIKLIIPGTYDTLIDIYHMIYIILFSLFVVTITEVTTIS